MASVEEERYCLGEKDKGNENQQNQERPSLADYTCPICLQILIEPVVMPCEHELCISCFRQNVEEANLQCPLCRIRISSWTRRQTRNGTLVNLKRWEQIKRLFPEKCQKRLRGEDDEDEVLPKLKRTISVSGEVRKEYETEMKKIRQAQEEELRASEEVIQRLLQEETKLQNALACQQKQDELLAKELYQNDKQNSQEVRSSSQSSHVPSSQKGKKSSSSVIKSKLVTLDKWFLPQKRPLDGKVSEEPCTSNSRLKDDTHSFSSNCVTAETLRLTKIPVSDVGYEQFDPGYAEQQMKQKRIQEEQDFLLAQKLQEDFNREQEQENAVERKKGTADAYLLRKVTQSTTVSSTAVTQSTTVTQSPS